MKNKWYTWVFSGIGVTIVVFVLSLIFSNGKGTNIKNNTITGQQNIFSGNFKGDVNLHAEQGLNTEEKEQLQSIYKSVQQLIAEKALNLRGDLSQRYPLGYMLFGVYEKKVIIPEKSEIKGDFSFIWDGVTVNEMTDTYIVITLPKIYDKRNGNIFGDNYLTLPLKEGFVSRPMKILDTSVVVELLNRNTPYIFVIAFEKQKDKN
jgi:hypothetical protein